ncbi:MAG: alpha-mannosidase [Candidatus Roseilinea sp.]|nr:MAG: alpha-mannosidase [Candidatus Roseilinea sp.]
MSKLKLFVVAHTHFDAEVFVSRDQTLQWGSENILDALYLLDRDPSYRYVLDQRCYVEGFARLYPEQMARLTAHVASGRLEMVGDMHAMPDTNIPSGESFVRQILYGRAYFERAFGRKSTIGWMLDSFGHHPQLPQIMRRAGFDVYVMQRGPAPDSPAAFQWVGIDGTRLRCEWMPHTYALISNAPANLPGFKHMIERIQSLIAPYVYNGQFMVLSGMDISAPEQHLPEVLRQFNASQSEVELVMATPSEYFAAQPADGLPEISGDLNPVFTGCYAARIAVKQHNREAEGKLIAAETLQAINWARHRQPVDTMAQAWEPVLFNQFHDIICGSHLDATYESAIARFKRATDHANAVIDGAFDTLTAEIDTRGEGIPLVVMNTLAQARTDVARITIGLGHERWESLALFDDEGEVIPLQIQNLKRHPDGSIKCADLIFIARVPALGYRTYFVRSGEGLRQPTTDLWVVPMGSQGYPGMVTGMLTPDEGRMGNSLIDVRANLRTGAIQSLILRGLAWDVVDSSHEHGFASVCRQEDQGDPWEYYGPLRGAITSTEPLVDPVPPRGQAAFTYQYGGQGWAAGGPVMAELGVRSPFGDGRYTTRIRLYAGLPRVELETELVNQQRFVRYRNVFPLNLKQPRITYEIPFGALDRPVGEYPAQNWVDVSDGERGVALLNRGIPGHSLDGSVLTSSLMKCVKVVSYEAGGYSAQSRDELGFEIGVLHRFEQAILPHAGDWRAAQVYHAGMAFNAPLIVRKVTPHAGALPSHGSFMALEPDHVTVHAIFVDRDQLVLRVVEAEGNHAKGKINLQWPIAAAHETDLMGNVVQALSVEDTRLHFSAAPFEIKTFRITLA